MEIKFRGLSHSSGWVYGSYIHSKRFVGCGNEHRIFNQDTGLESDVIGETVGQFTGLTDKYGKEIYSGDIVQHHAWNYPFEVIYHQEKARFVCKTKSGLTDYINNKGVEVIGNIFEHSELLKK